MHKSLILNLLFNIFSFFYLFNYLALNFSFKLIISFFSTFHSTNIIMSLIQNIKRSTRTIYKI